MLQHFVLSSCWWFIVGLKIVTVHADRDLLGLGYQLWKNTVYLDCLRKKKIPQSLFIFQSCYQWVKLALQIGHKRVSSFPVHFAIIQKVWETQAAEKGWKCLEKLWLLYRTKVPYYLGALQCVLINILIRQTKYSWKIRICASMCQECLVCVCVCTIALIWEGIRLVLVIWWDFI